MEQFYGGCLCYGPPIENGFYYDMFLDEQKWAFCLFVFQWRFSPAWRLITFALFRGVSSTEFGDLETLCKAVIKEKQPFERLELSKETLLKMFKVMVVFKRLHSLRISISVAGKRSGNIYVGGCTVVCVLSKNILSSFNRNPGILHSRRSVHLLRSNSTQWITVLN